MRINIHFGPLYPNDIITWRNPIPVIVFFHGPSQGQPKYIETNQMLITFSAWFFKEIISHVDFINFETNLDCLIKLFSHMT